MDILAKAKNLTSKTEAYGLLIEIAEELANLKLQKELTELELLEIKAEAFDKDPKLSSEKIEYTALLMKGYKDKAKALAQIESKIKLLQSLYDIISKSFLIE